MFASKTLLGSVLIYTILLSQAPRNMFGSKKTSPTEDGPSKRRTGWFRVLTQTSRESLKLSRNSKLGTLKTRTPN